MTAVGEADLAAQLEEDMQPERSPTIAAPNGHSLHPHVTGHPMSEVQLADLFDLLGNPAPKAPPPLFERMLDDIQGGKWHEHQKTLSAARLTPLPLNELRLPAMKALWQRFGAQAIKRGGVLRRLLRVLVEHENLASRDQRRHSAAILVQARLLPGKTLDTFRLPAVPSLFSNGACQQLLRLVTAGSSRAITSLLFSDRRGSAKSHSVSAYRDGSHRERLAVYSFTPH